MQTARNRLDAEKSPYLLQHRHNPVHWFAWSPEAFAAARDQHKPIFLSIGYSTCYWCHVMEKDSFEREDVAAILNEKFIAIKLDREERPDIDQIYMDAVVGLTGQGGWPMSVFLTPDLKPFWGGTFFPRAQFISILTQLREAWDSEHEKVVNSAKHIAKVLSEQSSKLAKVEISPAILDSACMEFVQKFDSKNAGFGRAPKFPPSTQLMFLLRAHKRVGDPKLLSMVNHTLQAMSRGGLYDQLAGGFHRYSTDADWLVPHFEKMLYDNALLATCYLEGFQVSKDPWYATIAGEVLGYVLREMTDAQGGFYSAQDAGEVGKEGEYYVWNESEVSECLKGERGSAFATAYQVTSAGNFEHSTNILHLTQDISIEERQGFSDARQQLLEVRKARPAPLKDDKVLCSWNGLMISAMAFGFQVLGEKKYLSAAQNAAGFIHSKLWKPGTLLRRFRDGEALIEACLEDYAYLIEGLITLYESDFNPKWLTWAHNLQQLQDKKLWDGEASAYNFSAAPEVFIQKKDFLDNATPSGNATSLLNLIRLHAFFGESWMQERFDALLESMLPLMQRYPAGFPKALQALEYHLAKSKELAIIGALDAPEVKQLLQKIRAEFNPYKVVAQSVADAPNSGIPLLASRVSLNTKPTFYLCEKGICQLPSTDGLSILQNLIVTE